MEEDYDELLEKFPPYEIEELTKQTIMNEGIFTYLAAIKNIAAREQKIIELEEKAKQFGILQNFKKVLKNYIKRYDANLIDAVEELKHNEVADKFLEHNIIAKYDNNLYLYVNGVYTNDRYIIERKIKEIIPQSDSRFRKEVYLDLYLAAEEAKLDKESGIINFKNGLFNLSEMKLQKHNPGFFSINQINVNYNEKTNNVKEIDNFLNTITNNNFNRKQALLEIIGYCMTTSVNLQKAFILYGETARNGKTTVCNLITELIGRNNIGNISLRDLSKNTFAGSGIKGKLLNIGSEMTEEQLNDVSIFKMFTTGDYMSVEEKFKSKETISPYAKFIFNANELPIVSDRTEGFYRRIHIIPFEASFTDEEIRKFNYKEIITQEALEYLAYLAVKAYTKMNDNLANYEESETEVKKYRLNSNSVISFSKDTEIMYSLEDKEGKIKASSVYDKYKGYCIDNRFEIIGRNKFYKEFEKNEFICKSEKEHQKYYSIDIIKFENLYKENNGI